MILVYIYMYIYVCVGLLLSHFLLSFSWQKVYEFEKLHWKDEKRSITNVYIGKNTEVPYMKQIIYWQKFNFSTFF